MSKKTSKLSGVNISFPTTTKTMEVLNSIVVNSKLPVEDISTLYEDAYMALETRGVKENIETLALNGVKNEVRKITKKATFEPKAKAVGLVGFIIGDGGLWDKIEQVRNAAKRYVDKNGIEAALEANLINGDNQVLDQRKKIFGKENPLYLEPLNEKVRDSTRTLHLIAKLNGSKVYKYGTIQTNDHSLAVGWGKVKFFKSCQTFGIVKEDPADTNGFKLNSSQAEDTLSVFKAVKENMDVDKIFMDVITPELTPIDNIEKFYETYKGIYGIIVFVKGVVAWINRDKPSPFGDIKMGIMDGDTGYMVTVSIPENIAADFGEQSEVIVYGRTKRQDLRDMTDDGKTIWLKGKGDVAIQAVGVYGIKGLVTPSDLNRPEALANEKEIEGWLE